MIKYEHFPTYLFSFAIDRSSYGLKNEFELAMANEPFVFESLKFDCADNPLLPTLDTTTKCVRAIEVLLYRQLSFTDTWYNNKFCSRHWGSIVQTTLFYRHSIQQQNLFQPYSFDCTDNPLLPTLDTTTTFVRATEVRMYRQPSYTDTRYNNKICSSRRGSNVQTTLLYRHSIQQQNLFEP